MNLVPRKHILYRPNGSPLKLNRARLVRASMKSVSLHSCIWTGEQIYCIPVEQSFCFLADLIGCEKQEDEIAGCCCDIKGPAVLTRILRCEFFPG